MMRHKLLTVLNRVAMKSDYANDNKSSVKKMGLFTFITYLTQHIPDKYFRVVRPDGIFSNRKRGELLPLAKQLLNQDVKKKHPSRIGENDNSSIQGMIH